MKKQFKALFVGTICISIAILLLYYFKYGNQIVKKVRLENNGTEITYSKEKERIEKVLDIHLVCSTDSDCGWTNLGCNAACDCPTSANKVYIEQYEAVKKANCPKNIRVTCNMLCTYNNFKCIQNKCTPAKGSSRERL